MDEQSTLIHNLLLNSTSPTQDIRKEAEKRLHDCTAHEGFLSHLLKLLISPQINPVAQQAGLIFFKNSIIKAFATTTPAFKDAKPKCTLSPSELSFIRANIVQVYISCNYNHRKLILPCISKLIQEDYLQSWPDLLQQLFQILKTGTDIKGISGAIDIMRLATDADNTTTKAQPHPIFTSGFPSLLNIASRILTSSLLDDESCLLLKNILKTFFTAIQFVLPNELQSEAAIDPWIGLSIHILFLGPHQSYVIKPEDQNSADLNPFFRMKKWALHVATRLSSRYGLDEQTKYRTKTYAQFSTIYMAKYAFPTLDAFLHMVQGVCSGQIILPDRLITLICDYLDSAILSNKLWKQIKPHLEPIIKLFIFPKLCFTDEDERIWSEDPYEYVHKRLDPFEDFESVSWAASNLLGNMVKKRKKSVFLPLLNFINEIFVGFSNPSSPYLNNVRAKEGALMVVGTISSSILDASELKGQTEALIMSAVLPDMSAESPFLRARACWVIQNYEDLRYSCVENVLAIFQGILRCLGDVSMANLPIRIQAALALGIFLQFEEVTPMVTTNLAPIVHNLLELTNQSDMDSLSYVLEKLVSLYSVELAPFALQLTQQLCATLMRLVSHPKVIKTLEHANETDEDDDFEMASDKLMTAMGILKTLTTLVLSIKSNPELTEKMEELFHEPIIFILQFKVTDLFEDILELVDSITFVRKQISSVMWSRIFPILYDYFMNGTMSDYLGDLLPCFDNFISYGGAVLAANQQLQTMFMAIIEKGMRNSEYGDEDRVSGCQLLESLLLSCRGAVDQFIPLILELSLSSFSRYESKSSIVHHMEVFLNCVIYDVRLTLQQLIVSKLPPLTDILDYIYANKGSFCRVHDKRLLVISMIQLLKCMLSIGECKLVFAILRDGFETLPKSIDHRKELEKDAENNDQDEGYDDYGGEEEEIDDEDDEQQPQALEKKIIDDKNLEEEEGEDDSNGDSVWEESELEEEIYHETPLDGINLYDMAVSALSELPSVNSNAFSYFNGSEEKHALLQALQAFQSHATAATANKPAAQSSLS